MRTLLLSALMLTYSAVPALAGTTFQLGLPASMSSDDTRDAQSDAQRDVQRDTARDASRDLLRDAQRDAKRDVARDQLRDSDRIVGNLLVRGQRDIELDQRLAAFAYTGVR